MTTRHKLPRVVKAAVSRRAYQLAMEHAYQALHIELEELACNLIERPNLDMRAIVEDISSAKVDYVARPHLQEA